MTWSKRICPRASKNKLTNLSRCSSTPLQSRSLHTPHTCSSGPFTVWSTFGADFLEKPTAMSLCCFLSRRCLETYSPSTAFSPLGIEKVTQGHVWWIQGLQHLWDLMFSQEVLDKVGWVGWGIFIVQLPVTLLPRHRYLAPHHITQLTENFNIILFVNSLTIWCLFMVNDRRKLPTSLSPCTTLGVPFWPWRPQSLPLWRLGFCFWVVPTDPRFIVGN